MPIQYTPSYGSVVPILTLTCLPLAGQALRDQGCICNCPNESVEHVLLDCFIYQEERQAMFDYIKNTRNILCGKLETYNRKSLVSVLLFGEYPHDYDIYPYIQPERRGREGRHKENANAWRSPPYQNIVVSLFFSFIFVQFFCKSFHGAISPSLMVLLFLDFWFFNWK